MELEPLGVYVQGDQLPIRVAIPIASRGFGHWPVAGGGTARPALSQGGSSPPVVVLRDWPVCFEQGRGVTHMVRVPRNASCTVFRCHPNLESYWNPEAPKGDVVLYGRKLGGG